MILVTGASGHLGGLVADILSAQGHPLRLMVRDRQTAPDLPGAEVAVADYIDPDSLDEAFAGIEAALVVSGHAVPMQRALLHKNAFDAAARAGVNYLVYTSFQGASPTSKFPFGRDHYQSEQYLKACGVPFTSLRNNLYLDVIPEFFGEQGVLRAPAGDGAAAWVARHDIAAVAAAELVTPQSPNAIYDVSGPEALTMAETAARLSAVVGRELHYQEETVVEGRAWRSTLGAPKWEVEVWLGSYEAVAAGELAAVSDTVQRLTGHPPAALEAYFLAHPELLEPLRK